MNLTVLVKVLKRPSYLLLTVLIAIMAFSIAVWLPNLGLITTVLGSTSSSLSDKLAFLFSLYGSIETNFTFVSASVVFLISGLFGVQVALLVYYIRRVRTGFKLGGAGTSGVVGLISGMFGVGCAACGAFILTSFLSLFGVAGILAYLPFGGQEFGLLGLLLLGYSISLLIKRINDPLVCEVKYSVFVPK